MLADSDVRVWSSDGLPVVSAPAELDIAAPGVAAVFGRRQVDPAGTLRI
jgi:hypothetical protein